MDLSPFALLRVKLTPMYRVLVLFVFAISALAQEATIQTTVSLVTIPVSLTDANGSPVDGISASDFVLLDNGKPQPVKVDLVESGIAPISLVAVVQTSNMSLAAIANIRKIGSMIALAVVGAKGAAALVTYDAQLKLVQDFTTDADVISEAFSGLEASDATTGHMLDAVERTLDLLAAQPEGRRRNILIIGEAKDRGSKAKLDTIIQKLQRTGTTVYSMNYSKLITPFTMKPEEYQPTGDYMQGMIELARLAKAQYGEYVDGDHRRQTLRFPNQSWPRARPDVVEQRSSQPLSCIVHSRGRTNLNLAQDRDPGEKPSRHNYPSPQWLLEHYSMNRAGLLYREFIGG